MLTRLLSSLFNLFQKFPSPHELDTSGIIYSDYPVENNGWIKGWLTDYPLRDRIIVAKHSNPSLSKPHNVVFARDANGIKHYRTIVGIDSDPFNIGSDDSHYHGGDIALCKLDAPFPDSICAYEICTSSLVHGKKTISLNQHGEYSRGKISHRGKLAYIRCDNRDIPFTPGDSGLPWFVYTAGTWKVISHTFRGLQGEGPLYSKIYDEIYSRLIRL